MHPTNIFSTIINYFYTASSSQERSGPNVSSVPGIAGNSLNSQRSSEDSPKLDTKRLAFSEGSRSYSTTEAVSSCPQVSQALHLESKPKSWKTIFRDNAWETYKQCYHQRMSLGGPIDFFEEAMDIYLSSEACISSFGGDDSPLLFSLGKEEFYKLFNSSSDLYRDPQQFLELCKNDRSSRFVLLQLYLTHRSYVGPMSEEIHHVIWNSEWTEEEKIIFAKIMVRKSYYFIEEFSKLPMNGTSKKEILKLFAAQSPFLLINYLSKFEFASNDDRQEILDLCAKAVESNPARLPLVNSNASEQDLHTQYLGLGEEKWRECIDGVHQHLGRNVYDEALHYAEDLREPQKEPGFLQSMQRAFEFIAKHLNRKIDPDWYLLLHKHTAGHFLFESTKSICGPGNVGVFRNNVVHMNLNQNRYSLKMDLELQALSAEIYQKFGCPFAKITPYYGDYKLEYQLSDPNKIKELFIWFHQTFYEEISQANTLNNQVEQQEAKLRAIAKLHRHLEWLHPVLDGATRTNDALLNKNLTDYGFHPVILERPSNAELLDFESWVEDLKNALLKWEAEREKISLTIAAGSSESAN